MAAFQGVHRVVPDLEANRLMIVEHGGANVSATVGPHLELRQIRVLDRRAANAYFHRRARHSLHDALRNYFELDTTLRMLTK